MIEINDSTTLLVAIFSVAISVLALAWQPLSHWLNGGRLAVRWSLFVWSPLTRTIHEWPVEDPLHPGESDLAGDFPGGLFFDGAVVNVTNRGRVPMSVDLPYFSIEAHVGGLRRWKRVRLVSPRPAPREVVARVEDASFGKLRVDAYAASTFYVSLREVRHAVLNELERHGRVRVRAAVRVSATGKYVVCPRKMIKVIRDRSELAYGGRDVPRRALVAWREIFDHAYFREQLRSEGADLLLQAIAGADRELDDRAEAEKFAKHVAHHLLQSGVRGDLVEEISTELSKALPADPVCLSTRLYRLTA